MKPVNLDELDRLHAAATPGPFIYGKSTADEHAYVAEADGTIICYVAATDDAQSDALAAYIHALLVNGPALSAELRTRRKQVEEARGALDKLSRGNRTTSSLAIARLALAALASLESGEGDHFRDATKMVGDGDHIGEPAEKIEEPRHE